MWIWWIKIYRKWEKSREKNITNWFFQLRYCQYRNKVDLFLWFAILSLFHYPIGNALACFAVNWANIFDFISLHENIVTNICTISTFSILLIFIVTFSGRKFLLSWKFAISTRFQIFHFSKIQTKKDFVQKSLEF